MIKQFEKQDCEPINLDIDIWRSRLLPYLKVVSTQYKFAGKSSVDIDAVGDKLTIPLLVYTLIEMYRLLDKTLSSHAITKDLNKLSKGGVQLDYNDMVTLSYEQAAFVRNYPLEVKAWLPLTVKKIVAPNYNKIDEVLYGRV